VPVCNRRSLVSIILMFQTLRTQLQTESRISRPVGAFPGALPQAILISPRWGFSVVTQKSPICSLLEYISRSELLRLSKSLSTYQGTKFLVLAFSFSWLQPALAFSLRIYSIDVQINNFTNPRFHLGLFTGNPYRGCPVVKFTNPRFHLGLFTGNPYRGCPVVKFTNPRFHLGLFTGNPYRGCPVVKLFI
jgi:hypothetical protein